MLALDAMHPSISTLSLLYDEIHATRFGEYCWNVVQILLMGSMIEVDNWELQNSKKIMTPTTMSSHARHVAFGENQLQRRAMAAASRVHPVSSLRGRCEGTKCKQPGKKPAALTPFPPEVRNRKQNRRRPSEPLETDRPRRSGIASRGKRIVEEPVADGPRPEVAGRDRSDVRWPVVSPGNDLL